MSYKLNLLAILLIQLSHPTFAEETGSDPGGYVEPGGYDPAAEAKKQKLIDDRLAAEKQKIENAAKIKAAAKKKQAELNALKPENMAKIDDDHACEKAGIEIRKNKTDNWQNEIKRRKLKLNTSDARSRKITIGSSVCDIYASFGPPERISRTVGRNYVRKQFIYPRQYIYTENDIVNSWQD